MLTSSGLIVPGLSSLRDDYDAILCDVWGVIHNGVAVFDEAAEALSTFRREMGGTVILITNAPRPYEPILVQLDNLGFPKDAYDAVVTSGDVTAELLKAEGHKAVYHIGPERDQSLFDELEMARVSPEESDTIVCTGLFDDGTETPDDYRESLASMAGRGMRMICANPDIVVERGTTMLYCAGALAEVYDELGGEAVRLGKPYSPIYKLARARVAETRQTAIEDDRILAIGDGMFTDIKGAGEAGFDALFITGGIHSADFGPVEDPDPEAVAHRLRTEGLTARAAIPKLRW
ncbi:MAG: TIGR01459 family HAD-type hydrolase [Pseudomonadota bacterium]